MGRMNRAFKRGTRRVLAAAGDPATLVPKTGGSLPGVLAHIVRDVEFTEGDTQTIMQRDEVEMLVDEVGALKAGDLFQDAAGAWWKVAKPLANNGYTVKAVIMETTAP